MQRLSVALAGLLDQLCLALRSRSMEAASVTAQLKLVGGGAHERTVQPPRPLGDLRTMLVRAQIDLGAHPLER